MNPCILTPDQYDPSELVLVNITNTEETTDDS